MRRCGERWTRAAGAILAAAALVVVVSACEQQNEAAVNLVREARGRADLPVDTALSAAAVAHSRAMCTAGATSLSNAPVAAYDEGPYEIHELVGRAPLDPTIADATMRDRAATSAIWTQWAGDVELTDGRWVDQAVGEYTCPDGYLYQTVVLRAPQSMPGGGLYSTQMYPLGQGLHQVGITYGNAVDYTGTSIPLLLDLFVPPDTAPGPRPAVVIIHGGAFAGGSRDGYVGLAQNWQDRGYVAITIDYRLDPRLNGPHTQLDQLSAAAAAIADAGESVRWLKAHAASYRVDPTRIAAVLGDSAGGAIALGLAATPRTPAAAGSPYAAYSPSVAAAVSTGAHLTPGFEAGVLTLHGDEAPILMLHYETDVASGTEAYAYETCTAFRAAGDVCDYLSQAGEGHTTSLSPGGQWWTNPIGSFLWRNLRLATAGLEP